MGKQKILKDMGKQKSIEIYWEIEKKLKDMGKQKNIDRYGEI